MTFVLDASIAGTWCLPDETDALADAAFAGIASGGAWVPALFWFEIRNLLLVNERRGRIDSGSIAQLLMRLDAMPIEADHEPRSGDVLELARTHGLSVYDAAYLELAQRRALPLATADRRLAAAARAAGVPPFAG